MLFDIFQKGGRISSSELFNFYKLTCSFYNEERKNHNRGRYHMIMRLKSNNKEVSNFVIFGIYQNYSRIISFAIFKSLYDILLLQYKKHNRDPGQKRG